MPRRQHAAQKNGHVEWTGTVGRHRVMKSADVHRSGAPGPSGCGVETSPVQGDGGAAVAHEQTANQREMSRQAAVKVPPAGSYVRGSRFHAPAAHGPVMLPR